MVHINKFGRQQTSVLVIIEKIVYESNVKSF